MSIFTKKDPITRFVEQDIQIQKSPITAGIIEGAKAAVIAAPMGAAIQGLRGKNMYLGGFVSGLGAALAAGLSAAGIQKFENVKQEAKLRYHMRNLIDREPAVFLPDPQDLNQIVYTRPSFSRGMENVYPS
jgi:hypothetical protein